MEGGAGTTCRNSQTTGIQCHRLVGWLVGKLICCIIVTSLALLVRWFVQRLLGGLVVTDWLVGWFVGWSVAYLGAC